MEQTHNKRPVGNHVDECMSIEELEKAFECLILIILKMKKFGI